MSTIRREQLRSPLSASYALTASYAENANATFNSSSLVTTSSFNAFTASINNFTSSYNTGSFSGSFTGSLSGTASFANNSISASYVLSSSNALTASYVNPLHQNVIITGGLSVRSTNGSASILTDPNGGAYLYEAGDIVSGLNTVSVDSAAWTLRTRGATKINWNSNRLQINDSIYTVDWGQRKTYDANLSSSIDWQSRILYDQNNTQSIDWENKTLNNNLKWDNTTFYPINDDSVDLGISPDNRFRYGYFVRDVYADRFITASVNLNTITFTKGDTSQFSITVDTGSGGGGGNVSGFVTTSSFNTYTASINSFTSSINLFTASYNTGSFTGSFTGSLLGTASWAVTTSYALTASVASVANQASDIVINVINQSGAQINKGIVVRITGSNNASDIPRIGVADWTNDNLSANTIGLVMADIPNGSTGSVMTEGLFLGYDTSTPGWISGQLLFLGANGSITGSAPQAPLHAVRLGQVIRAQSNNGSIYVRIDNGYEIDELHDILITNPTNGDLLIRSSSVWINSKQLTGSYNLIGDLQATSFTGSLQGTSSWANNSISSSYVLSSSFASTASFVQTAQTASYILQAVSASFATTALTASFLPVGTYAITASWAQSASQAITASYVLQAVSASFLISSSFSTNIGDGVNTSYTVTHNLNTRNAHITVYSASGTYETVYPDIQRPTVNTATIIFANPPTTNQYTVYISI